MEKLKAGFIGLGLIGGSIAKALRQYYPNSEIVAFDKNLEALALATQEAVVNVACTGIDDNFKNCDYIFLCAPTAFNTAYLNQVSLYKNDHLIITDVGSVKTPIHTRACALGLSDCFIGGHPMAGSEKSGFANSAPLLIENAYYILTPGENVPKDRLEEFHELLTSLHCIPVILDPVEHDNITGTISHLPHIIAASLVNYVREHDLEGEPMKYLAAGGFKDITRIASSSPTMWLHICLENKEKITSILHSYKESLDKIEKMISNEDSAAIYDMFDLSRNYRNSMPDNSSGPIKKRYAIYCDIPDEAGVIATIATILASNGISLKNIGIIHNREFEEGVLQIEFYDESSCSLAVSILQRHHYIIYER